MEKVTRIASYLLDCYLKQFGEKMDEIKLQKLLYFTQREAIIRTGKPMFDAEFRAWKYGPVVIEVHERYKNDDLHEQLSEESLLEWKECLDYVLSGTKKIDEFGDIVARRAFVVESQEWLCEI